ncbi:hypothetical protein VISI1226_08429 [Vibrio sinaloensis DSM 21326]|uniref:YbaK/aminoacyl-tRNA synthetase-associated domain-containing protein n=1 Tax=Vibrio sinaloensis DSM 21326 TaxID=945550 RepID=E8MDF3_PHOS4|nr:YbaK/EbsC family protein [Vibrio sinaloensis]EGA67939.1 hypothetical protein VISI1226_08429 [Vibrio sinaloensis DSM 21326]
MSTELKSSSQRVQAFLTQHGQEFSVVQMPDSTRTAVEAADAIGCTVAQIAKSLIFKNALTEEAILVVASGTNQVCSDKVQQATGFRLAKANAAFVRDKVGFAIGGVPPVAHSNDVITLLDNDLLNYDEIWAAAGTPNSVFKLKPSDLSELTGGQWLDVSK